MSSSPRAANAPSGAKLLDQSSANPGSIDKSIFEKKSGMAVGSATGQGTVNPNYLQECREDNSESASPAATQGQAVLLSNCRFLTPVADLRCDEEFEMAVDAKVTGSVDLGQVDFRLHSFLTKDGKEQRSQLHTWQGYGMVQDSKADPAVVTAKGKLIYEVGTDKSRPIAFELEAKHCMAKESVKSPRVEVEPRSVAHWMGGGDLLFRVDSEFPLLGADGSLIRVLSAAVRRVEKTAQNGETVICFGFASSAGDADRNRKVSLRRAQAVKAILDRDAKLWEELAKTNFGTLDIQQFLSDLHAVYGWDCDPGALDGRAGPATEGAIESFQRECNSRYGARLKEDGICGPRTWGGVLRVILGQIQSELGQDTSKEPSWKKPKWGNAGKGVYGNGEDFATGGDKPDERSVQITFFSAGAEQRLEDPKPEQKATTKDNPVQDGTQVEKRKIPTLEERLAAPKKGSVIHVGIFFDGTDNNRDRDRPNGHDSNVSKLFDLYNHDNKTRFAFYLEGVATGDWKESDFPTGGLFGRGISERVRRAWANLNKVIDSFPNGEIRVSLFGFSRGAATVLAFINHILAPSTILPGAIKATFDKIWFVGIFDAVGSIGIPGDSDEGDHDLHAWKSRIRSLTHFVSRDERRLLFPLTSVRSLAGAALPQGWVERAFAGVHSDVGGGYENEAHREPIRQTAIDRDRTSVASESRTDKRDHLSRVAGWTMYEAACRAGVPMHALKVRDAFSGESLAARLFAGEDMSKETPENGWTLFQQVEGSDPRVEETLGRLRIHPSLLPLWKNRNDPAEVQRRIDPRHPDYASHIAPFKHDSMSWKDPRGIGTSAGIAPGGRNIFYRGSNA